MKPGILPWLIYLTGIAIAAPIHFMLLPIIWPVTIYCIVRVGGDLLQRWGKWQT